MPVQDPRSRIVDNPFYVLGVSPDCTRAEVEREGQKLLGMLELGLSSARTYATPLGVFQRTTDNVRAAMAELRDPERRLAHEVWAQLAPHALTEPADMDSAGAADDSIPAAPAGWPGALAALGWKR